MTQIQDQTLALASMFQSATLINQLAHGEEINPAAFDCSVDSLFTLNASSTQEIFGHGEGLMLGLKTLQAYLGGQKNPDKLIAYYVLSMIKITTRLLENEQLVQEVRKGLQDVQQQTGDFDMSLTGKLHKVDGLYQNTISRIKPRIMVQGEQSCLSRSDTTSKIRTLLFAGVRAAVLWKQRGGSRLKLVFSRKKTLREAASLLSRF